MSPELSAKLESGEVIAKDLQGNKLTCDQLLGLVEPQSTWMYAVSSLSQMKNDGIPRSHIMNWIEIEYEENPPEVGILSNRDEVEIDRVIRDADFPVAFGLDLEEHVDDDVIFMPIHFKAVLFGREFLAAVYLPEFVGEEFDFVSLIDGKTEQEMLDGLAELTPLDWGDWRLLPLLLRARAVFVKTPESLDHYIKYCLNIAETNLREFLMRDTEVECSFN